MRQIYIDDLDDMSAVERMLRCNGFNGSWDPFKSEKLYTRTFLVPLIGDIWSLIVGT